MRSTFQNKNFGFIFLKIPTIKHNFKKKRFHFVSKVFEKSLVGISKSACMIPEVFIIVAFGKSQK